MAQLETKSQTLQQLLELLVKDTDEFSRTPLCQPDSLRGLLGPQYETAIRENFRPHELAVEGLKQLVANIFWEALDGEDVNLAHGAVILWFRYL